MINDLLTRIASSSHRAGYKLHVKSALNPALWLCAIVSPVCFLFAFVFRDTQFISTLLIWIGICPVLVSCFSYIFFAIFKPDKLQSEDYQLRHESLKIIQQKSGRITVPDTSIEAIANPYIKQIDNKENGE